jgi:hypothetical protein
VSAPTISSNVRSSCGPRCSAPSGARGADALSESEGCAPEPAAGGRVTTTVGGGAACVCAGVLRGVFRRARCEARVRVRARLRCASEAGAANDKSIAAMTSGVRLLKIFGGFIASENFGARLFRRRGRA